MTSSGARDGSHSWSEMVGDERLRRRQRPKRSEALERQLGDVRRSYVEGVGGAEQLVELERLLKAERKHRLRDLGLTLGGR